MKDYMERFDHS